MLPSMMEARVRNHVAVHDMRRLVRDDTLQLVAVELRQSPRSPRSAVFGLEAGREGVGRLSSMMRPASSEAGRHLHLFDHVEGCG
jgi:hypothetical protein